MMTRSRQNRQEKVANAFFLSSQKLKIESALFTLLILFLPTQLGKHFWPTFSVIEGIRVDYLSPTLYLTDVLISFLFIVWLVNHKRELITSLKNNKAKFFYLSLCLVTFCSYIFLQGMFFNSVFNSAYHLLKLFEFIFVAGYVAQAIRTTRNLFFVTSLLSMGIIGESFLAIAQFVKQAAIGGPLYFFGERFFTSQTPGIANASIDGELLLRPYGTFSHPNVLAGFLLVSLFLLLFLHPLVKRKEIWTRRLWQSALLVGTSGLLLSMSRIVIILWLVMIGWMIIAGFYKKLFSKKQRHIALLILLGIGFVFFFFLSTPVAVRLLQTSLTETAIRERVELINVSLGLFKQQPFFGWGLGSFLPAFSTLHQSFAGSSYLQPVHNIFLLVLVESGLGGLFLVSALIAKTYKRLFGLMKKNMAKKRMYQTFFFILTTILILGSFDHYLLTLQQGQLLLAFVFGLCWTTIKSAKK